jgi:glycosyltransferase involved in cell wall biosynthesis
VRILLVSLMYPGPSDPDLGAFLVPLVDQLRARGNDVELAVLNTRSGGKRRYFDLLGIAWRAARRTRPDVVYAHFLVPTGVIGMLASRAPLVVTAHGQDVANVGRVTGIRLATRVVVRRSTALIAVSHYLRRELESKVPDARGKTKVIDSGVDLDRFRPTHADEAAARVSWPAKRPGFLFVGSLTERKNVLRLANAFERAGRGSLAFVGDGPLRDELHGRPGITLVGRVPQEDLPDWYSAADVVCQPSLVEPFGQATLEAMACARSVVATRAGGPPEFVPPGAGVLVDPEDEAALAAALIEAAGFETPNLAARAAAEQHDVRLQAAAIEAVLAAATALERT